MTRIGTVVELSIEEQRISRLIGTERYKNNRGKSVGDKSIDGNTGPEKDINAFAAELALCKLFNVYPDLTLSVRSQRNGTDGGDAVIFGKTIDVKETQYRNGHLLAVPWTDRDKCDLYALMIGKMPVYEFRGFLPSRVLIREDHKKNMGYGMTYAATQEELQELEELFHEEEK